MGLIGGFRLGSLFGIEVAIDWSLTVIFLLIAFSLAVGVFPAWHPDWSPALNWVTALAAAVVFFASLLAHEFSHALVGRRIGVDVRRITLFMFGGMAHMENEPPSWRGEFLMAIVGPLTSLVLGLAFLWIAAAVHGPILFDPDDPGATLATLGPVVSVLLWLGPINILLAVFNLVPGFPLDGGRVLRALLWGATGNQQLATRWASRAGQAFGWVLIATGILMILGWSVPVFGTGFVGGLWLIFIGWFLNAAAVASYRQLLLQHSLGDVPVRRLMQSSVTRVDPQMRVGTLVEELVMPSGQRAFPVEVDGRLAGMVSLRDLQKIQREAWDRTSVGQIMTPVGRLTMLAPGQSAAEALDILGQRDLNQLPVVSGEVLQGLLRREDIVKWLALHGAPDVAEGRAGQYRAPAPPRT
ncbi:MAG TPA: site-2 protease family protein [Lysobacter sp.]|nr:site-2 protease family protein [Lysobacter sp.]